MGKREKTRAKECDTGADVDDEGRGQAPKNNKYGMTKKESHMRATSQEVTSDFACSSELSIKLDYIYWQLPLLETKRILMIYNDLYVGCHCSVVRFMDPVRLPSDSGSLNLMVVAITNLGKTCQLVTVDWR